MRPLIDPREGDVEDDSSSPGGRSLLAITGSLVAEISPAKLALAVTSLVLVPGLLLGVTPLALGGWLATLSGQVTSAAGLLAVPVVAAVVAVGWLGGRPLFRAAERSFWSLNALAVQPGYALFREILRHGVERVVAKRAGPVELARVRAASAAAAGLLASIVALAVLAAVWPSTRWIGVPADLAAPLRLLEPALYNTVALLSGYLAVASLGWGLADATMAQPRDVETFAVPATGARTWRVAHLSDLHAVGGPYEFRLQSGRAGPRGNDRMAAALDRLAASHAERPLDLVLLTGDMTDAGRSTEWAAVLDALERYPELRARTPMLPGNHDLNVIDRANPARLDLPG
ncbi:MAG: metallophosphoesterase, partial [Deinococcus-Thermus bacterium]|nr:metallophosphoesterase [Deinococcota bacterium]